MMYFITFNPQFKSDEMNLEGMPYTYSIGIGSVPTNSDSDGDGMLEGVDKIPIGLKNPSLLGSGQPADYK